MRRGRSKLGGRSCQRLVRLLNNGELDGLSSNEMVKVLRNDARMVERFASFLKLDEIEPSDVSPLIETRPDLIDRVSDRLGYVDPNVWANLVRKDPSVVVKMPRSLRNLAALVAVGLGNVCGSDDFTGSMWRDIILCDPRCFKYCDVRKMTESDWLAIYPVRYEAIEGISASSLS